MEKGGRREWKKVVGGSGKGWWEGVERVVGGSGKGWWEGMEKGDGREWKRVVGAVGRREHWRRKERRISQGSLAPDTKG